MSYDVLVIGGGPAGLSASINVRARGRSALVVSNPLEENPLWRAEKVDNYLGLPGLSGAEMLAAMRRHAEQAGVEFLAGKVLNAVQMPDAWYVSVGPDMYNARAVVLAAGVARGKKFAGEAELLGRGVSYCATCDGMLYRNKPVAVVGRSKDAPHEAAYLKSIGCQVVYVAPKRPDQLSKGNQQKIQLMAALLSDPELLILDEPLSGLDPINTDLFKGIIREEIAAGKYLIMSSHQMATVEEFCTDLTILDRSKTVLQGHLNDIKRSYGRVHLQLKTESDPAPYIAECGAQIVTQKEFEYQLKVTGAQQANGLLARLTQAGVPVVLFNLREPSLHEIFVETVGGESDA